MKIKIRKKFLPIATAVFGKEEEREVIETLRSGWITLGPRTKKFEEDLAKYVGVRYAIATSSCSAALHLAMLAIGIKKGDEVITTPFTFAATAHAIIHCGGKPVFVDIDPQTFNIDPKKIEKKITAKTKAILPVDYGGQPVDLDAICQIAKKHNLYVVEDAAHTIGAKYKGKNIGPIADLTCFSFHPVKNMTTGDGGAVVTNNKKLAEKIMVLRVNGMDKESWKRNTSSGTWDYAIVSDGYKYHMNDIQAALGIQQIKKLEKFRKIREKLANVYDEYLADYKEVQIPKRVLGITHAHNIYGILVDTTNLKITRNEIMERLKEYNIGSIVYFRPLHLQPYFQKTFGYKTGDFPNAEYVFDRLICLPLYPGMGKSDVLFVVKVLKSIISDFRI
ncbi:UDP-4-amino-4,6-dideoxy-N-acetyl-beta-L-altrosamine transaminase [Candidatus Daviesbacteria bacterium RIFCSPLOWO2_01_FULL_39_12]|uniref:UDP-4-amino-4, 6-dideoxy-N-acetyl-beta-L-altrosamine transaminase n=1 Tax=Candidatus Daviesbacteria bacterium RIFCSPLOWO2_01_FULL_39_12 TaxID=1797785 RepID=A0A1F5KP34_9BACT|nr:MAG: UDP-4-amino-4,6-dideoxy-N-acetyl-beta-L-altrosamine transaminase [Candidatus Daviesbacteria bacterium RIFCSPLOWO2_01_FULL_39_12]